jgi:integrator complex subunit 1
MSFAGLTEDTVSKVAKTNPAMSPMMTSSIQRSVSGEQKISLPIQIIAASIFYVSLRHLTHWPAQLLHAYAEDAFGPRLWVDHNECAVFVANLQLAHDKKALEMKTVGQVLQEAEQVANFYASMMSNLPPDDEGVDEDEVYSNPSHPRQCSFTFSSGETDLAREASIEEAQFSENDSDSGEEEVVDVGSAVKSTSRSGGGDDSSSSGEEEVLTTEASFDVVKKPLMALYPVSSTRINLESIRPRYFGINSDVGLMGISQALSARLETKSKQNSRLLQTLPDFCTLPGVRSLIATNLEKWLQSPALSGAARTLFTTTVHYLEDCDPPLPEDLETIDAVLDMQLKANQLNIHVENITHIAKRIPTCAISRRMFLKLLPKELDSMDNATQSSEHLKMICAVHMALTRSMSHDGLASAILTLLAEPGTNSTRLERNRWVRNVRMMLRRLLATLGPTQFDGCGLVESLLSLDFVPTTWSARDEEDKGRIILECVALLVPNLPDDAGPIRGKNMKKFHKSNDNPNALSVDEVSKLKRVLVVARKLLITWCVMDYAPRWQIENGWSSLSQNGVRRSKEDIVVGAGPPDFTSVLDSESTLTKGSTCPDAVKCVLFMFDPDSPEMQSFLYPEGPPQQGDTAFNEELFRLRQCYQYGADLDDNMLSIVLTAAADPARGINASVALTLIEHLFECCKLERGAELRISDVSLLWDMYELVEYHPDTIVGKPKIAHQRGGTDDQYADAEIDGFTVITEKYPGAANGGMKPDIPRLAHPGCWWRVTSLALVVIGASPAGIGVKLCDEIPTLRELTKMVTSGRYRFPTVDCNEAKRDEMKKGESDMRQLESNAAEFLFLPPEPKKSSSIKPISHQGWRISARQRQRNEDKLRDQREKDAAIALALATNRKKMLKAAQKSIMVWDPSGPARKPPKESVNLILAVERLFGLSGAFQRSEEPDLVQAAIGDTSRGAIERAYDWLIPVISSNPTVINRLPANASCYLLLRVYGTESEGDSKLRELSAPLLQHIRRTVTGIFGQADAIGASNLLLADVADKNPARRRCARRVLEETLAELNSTVQDQSFSGAKCTWLHSLLLLEHVDALIPDAIMHISYALSHERGRVLRAFTLSLKKYIDVASTKGIRGEWNFSSSLCDLISSRQSICSDAFSRFRDLFELAIKVVYDDVKRHLESEVVDLEAVEHGTHVQFTPCRSSGSGYLRHVRLPLSLLQSACVLLSIWKDAGDTNDESKVLVNELANILMFQFDSPESLLLEADGVEGVASATMVESGDRAVSVDGWVMLAKSLSDNIARRAALSAPVKFLPRLLLCSGLPKSSLLTMIDRVGKLGEQSDAIDKVYRELLMPSATMDWGFGQIGTRREIARKLIGRLSAYISRSGDSLEKLSEDVSFTFIGWLSEESRPPEKQRKGRPLKKSFKARDADGIALKLSDVESLLANFTDVDDVADPNLDCSDVSLCAFKTPSPIDSPPPVPKSDAGFEPFIRDCCSRCDSDSLESWIETDLFSERRLAPPKRWKMEDGIGETSKCAVALVLLDCSISSPSLNPEWIRAVERWVPLLSASEANPAFWKVLFSLHESELNAGCVVAACACAWCPFTATACRDWILSHGEEWKGLNLLSLTAFLVHTSGRNATHAPSFQQIDGTSASTFFQSKESVDGIVSLAFECATVCGDASVRRNSLAGWLQLLLLVAQCGKVQANHLIQDLLRKVEDSKHDGIRMVVAEAILRVYCYFPSHVSLANPRLRMLLVDASKSVDWRTWRTPIDETLNDMLAGLKLSPSQRLVHGLVDVTKSYPLMLLRKLDAMADILEDDAVTRVASGVSRARLQADDIDGPATAMCNDKDMKIVIRHWGYSYTDPLWVSLIEILLSVPREVLFSCGMKMGLDGLLLVYVKLMYVQCQLQSREKSTRLKSRFTDLMAMFEKDATAWDTWLATQVPGLDSTKTVRSVLVRCSLISTDQAMENIRKRVN